MPYPQCPDCGTELEFVGTEIREYRAEIDEDLMPGSQETYGETLELEVQCASTTCGFFAEIDDYSDAERFIPDEEEPQ